MEEALKRVCAKHLHQCFWLPANEAHGRLRVTYATTSNFENDTLPAILFCGPMFGGRWMALELDHLASTIGVRVICLDRPGMGGSTRVQLEARIPVWLEAVRALLGLLDVQHVSLVSHSAGTLYSLNTLYHQRDILDPKSPYAAWMGPWVDNQLSHVTLMNLAAKIPTGAIDSWNSISKFVNTRIVPGVAWSGGILSSAGNIFQAETNSSDSSDARLAKKWGVSEEITHHMDKLSMKFCNAEDSTAANEEVKLCLKKAGPGYWGICEDYEEYVRLLLKAEKDRNTSDNSPKLRVDFFFAESDMLVGEGGKSYIERCFKQDGVANTIDFYSETLAGTNHDTVLLNFERGALTTIFEHIKSQHQT